MRLDLHMHSYYSDGVFDLHQLLDAIKLAGIDLFALTDHDTIEGCDQMAIIAQNAGVNFIKGVEVACSFEGKEYHLTTYAYKDEAQLQKVLEKNLALRRAFDYKMIQACGLEIEAFEKYEDDPYLGGWPSLNYLKQKGIVDSVQTYFDLMTKHGLKLVFDSPEIILPKLKACGAKVFLAHPSAYFKGPLEARILDLFKDLGLDGLECYSPYTSDREEIQYYIDYCHQNDLYKSGGSDYHGGFVNRKLGKPYVDDTMVSVELFNKLIER